MLNQPDGLSHSAQLLEDPLEIDTQTSNPNEKPAYYALSSSGNITAEYVYVGYVSNHLFTWASRWLTSL